MDRLAETLVEQLPLSQPVEPVPAGLSAKEIARLRAQTLSPQVPQPSHDPSTSNVPQSTLSPNAVNESGGETPPYDFRRLVHTEVESLVRREMERHRAEGLETVAPPSYTEGDGQPLTGS
jgi:hypothetical protein